MHEGLRHGLAVGLLVGAVVAGCSGDTADVGGDGDDHTDCSPARPADVGSERRSFDSGGVRREYEVTIPPGYDGTSAAPLLLSLHGFTSNIEEQDAASNFPIAAAERGYIVVTPQALAVKVPLGGTEVEAPLWNIAPAFSQAAAPGQGELEAGDDVGFLTALLDTLEADELCVDPDRVYVSGISNGAGMTTMLVCNDDYRFAAAAPVAGVNMTTSCSPTDPTPVIAFHGDADTLVPYEGGSLLGYDLGLPAVEQQVTDLAVVGGCDPTPEAEQPFDDVRHLVWDCPEGMAAELYTVIGGGHTWPGSTAYAESDATAGAREGRESALGGRDLGSILGHQTENVIATELILDFFDANRVDRL